MPRLDPREIRQAPQGGSTMLDLVFLAVTVASFAISILFVKILGRM
jgi:hypothetical protein